MRLAWVALAGFRSYRELRWDPEPAVNLVVGANGAGKTNLLEGIGYLSTLASFRGSPDEALVGHDVESAVVRGEIVHQDATLESSTLVEIEVRRRGGRRALVNRVRLQRTGDLLGAVRLVTFLPEDLDIIKGGPSSRRAFLDAAAVQLWPGSHQDHTEYDRAVRQRNAYFKHGDGDEVTLEVWDRRLSEAAGKVMVRRARTINSVLESAGDAYSGVAGVPADLRIGYGSEWGGELDPSIPAAEHTDRLRAALQSRRRVDRDRRMTTVGPHRDEPVVLLNGYDLRFHGSQGEQRTAALALRLATHRAIATSTGHSPLLVLDDVFSELDPERSAALAAALPPDTQTLISTADRADVPLDGRVWTISGGVIT